MDILLASPQLDVFEQMALDETLVRVRPQAVTLRFYRWTPGPAGRLFSAPGAPATGSGCRAGRRKR